MPKLLLQKKMLSCVTWKIDYTKRRMARGVQFAGLVAYQCKALKIMVITPFNFTNIVVIVMHVPMRKLALMIRMLNESEVR